MKLIWSFVRMYHASKDDNIFQYKLKRLAKFYDEIDIVNEEIDVKKLKKLEGVFESSIDDSKITKNHWSFVENFYPRYSTCDFISDVFDLDKILSNEHHDREDLNKILCDQYEGNIKHPNIEINYLQGMITIYISSIENYMENHLLE